MAKGIAVAFTSFYVSNISAKNMNCRVLTFEYHYLQIVIFAPF